MSKLLEPYATHHCITSYIRELDDCRPWSSTGSGQTTRRARARRVALANGFVKIKVDGATSRTTTRGSYSAVCRDATGMYLVSYAIKCKGIH